MSIAPNPNLRAALDWAEAGYQVMPCWASKKPCIKGWPDAGTIDAEVIRTWPAKYPGFIPGLLCGPNNLLVIDQDRHLPGVDGVAEWEKLCVQQALDQSGCLVVETPSHGRHTYLRQKKDHHVGNTSGKIGRGIDTRGAGGYVIAPGAVLPDGSSYRVLSGAIGSSPIVPDDLHAFLSNKTAPGLAADATLDPIAMTPAVKSRHQTYAINALADEWNKVRNAPLGRRNTIFNNAVFSGATLIANFGVTVSELEPLKSAAREAGLSEEETAATFASALEAGQKNPRAPLTERILPEINIQHISCHGVPLFPRAPTDLAVPAWPWKSLSALQHKTFPAIKWVVPRYLPQGLTVFGGRPKLGKSWWVLDCGLAVASGGEALGERCEEGDVLYAALEDTERRLKRRVEKICSGKWPGRFSYTVEMPRADEGGIEFVRSWLSQASAPRLVIIDVLAKVRSSRGRDEGNYDADYKAVSAWKALADEFEVAIVLVHHVRKMQADDPLEMVSGTNGLTGAADAVLILNRDSQGCTLSGRGRDLEEFDIAVRFDLETCRWVILGEAPAVRRSDERNAIIRVLSETEPMSPAEIATASSMVSGSVRFLLHNMVAVGEVEKTGRGRYVLPSRVANIANNDLFQ